MDSLLYAGLTMAVFAVIFSFIGRRSDKLQAAEESYVPKYSYSRKQFIMSKAENDFYRVLQRAVGTNYAVYPQVHLSTFLSHTVKGQDWRAALSVIQRKSVDFLVCSRGYYNPLVAIELDDSSHDLPARKKRDEVVEAICKNAGMPLVRIRWQSSYDANEVLQQLSPYLR